MTMMMRGRLLGELSNHETASPSVPFPNWHLRLEARRQGGRLGGRHYGERFGGEGHQFPIQLLSRLTKK